MSAPRTGSSVTPPPTPPVNKATPAQAQTDEQKQIDATRTHNQQLEASRNQTAYTAKLWNDIKNGYAKDYLSNLNPFRFNAPLKAMNREFKLITPTDTQPLQTADGPDATISADASNNTLKQGVYEAVGEDFSLIVKRPGGDSGPFSVTIKGGGGIFGTSFKDRQSAAMDLLIQKGSTSLTLGYGSGAPNEKSDRKAFFKSYIGDSDFDKMLAVSLTKGVTVKADDLLQQAFEDGHISKKELAKYTDQINNHNANVKQKAAVTAQAQPNATPAPASLAKSDPGTTLKADSSSSITPTAGSSSSSITPAAPDASSSITPAKPLTDLEAGALGDRAVALQGQAKLSLASGKYDQAIAQASDSIKLLDQFQNYLTDQIAQGKDSGDFLQGRKAVNEDRIIEAQELINEAKVSIRALSAKAQSPADLIDDRIKALASAQATNLKTLGEYFGLKYMSDDTTQSFIATERSTLPIDDRMVFHDVAADVLKEGVKNIGELDNEGKQNLQDLFVQVKKDLEGLIPYKAMLDDHPAVDKITAMEKFVADNQATMDANKPSMSHGPKAS